MKRIIMLGPVFPLYHSRADQMLASMNHSHRNQRVERQQCTGVIVSEFICVRCHCLQGGSFVCCFSFIGVGGGGYMLFIDSVFYLE